MTAGNWYEVSIAAVANPPYVPPASALPGFALDALAASTSIFVFCIDDSLAGGTKAAVATYGGGSGVIPIAAMTIIAAPTQLVQAQDGGSTSTYTHDNAGRWIWFNDSTGIVDRITSPAALKAF